MYVEREYAFRIGDFVYCAPEKRPGSQIERPGAVSRISKATCCSAMIFGLSLKENTRTSTPKGSIVRMYGFPSSCEKTIRNDSWRSTIFVIDLARTGMFSRPRMRTACTGLNAGILVSSCEMNHKHFWAGDRSSLWQRGMICKRSSAKTKFLHLYLFYLLEKRNLPLVIIDKIVRASQNVDEILGVLLVEQKNVIVPAVHDLHHRIA